MAEYRLFYKCMLQHFSDYAIFLSIKTVWVVWNKEVKGDSERAE